MQTSLKRWMSGIRAGKELDIALRMKADMEKTGGAGLRQFMGGGEGTDGWTFEMGTDENLDWHLAVKVNIEAALAAEVYLKGISGIEGKGYGHNLMAAYSDIDKEKRQLIQKEYRLLCRLANDSKIIRKKVRIPNLVDVLQSLEGKFVDYGNGVPVRHEVVRFIDYRYLERDRIEAHDWWPYWVACEALGNCAHTWVDEDAVAHLPRIMVSDPNLSKEDRRQRRRNTKQRMARVLGRDINETNQRQKESPVWRKC